MALPKRRQSKARRNKRRANDALSAPIHTSCTNCGATIMPHRVCNVCGHYRGKQIISIKQKKVKTKEEN